MKKILKWTGILVVGLISVVALAGAFMILSFNKSMSVVHDVESPNVTAVADSAVIARGLHLANSIGGCMGCHGADLAGGLEEDFGPVGVMRPPNITPGSGGLSSDYTDGKLARAIKYGIDANGNTLRIMPSKEHNWWPESDLVAVVSYLRSIDPVDEAVEPTTIGTLGKILSQLGIFELRSAHEIDRTKAPEDVPNPEPTARYGQFLVRGCMGCHGDGLSGGAIPGAPPELAIPANLTPHETGLKDWSREDFFVLLNTGIRPDGQEIDAFMTIASTKNMNELEKTAIWEYLRSLEPVEFGNR